MDSLGVLVEILYGINNGQLRTKLRRFGNVKNLCYEKCSSEIEAVSQNHLRDQVVR
jgi:hypothetical protein